MSTSTLNEANPLNRGAEAQTNIGNLFRQSVHCIAGLAIAMRAANRERASRATLAQVDDRLLRDIGFRRMPMSGKIVPY